MMFTRILIATSDRDIGDSLLDYLEETIEDIDPTRVEHLLAAERKLEGDAWQNYDLLIIDNGLRKDRKSVRHQDSDLGIALLRDLRARDVLLPSILIVNEVDGNILNETRRLAKCEPVHKQGAIDDNVDLAIQELAGRPERNGGAKARANAVVEIDISSERKQDYRVHYRSGNKPFRTRPKPLDVRWRELQDICQVSKALRENRENWEPILKMIGRKLLDELLRSREFSKDFYRTQGTDLDQKDLFIRFGVSRETYGIACEAIYDEERGFLMLQSPVTRTVACEQHRDPLFRNGGNGHDPINILFIQANAHGYIPKLDLSVEELSNIEVEREFFERCRDGDMGEEPVVTLGTVHILAPEGNDDEGFVKLVKGHLEGTTGDPDVPKKFQIVHFAGHSVFSEEDDQEGGYLIFPGPQIEAVSIREFSYWLEAADTRLAYLSSCRSSDAEAAFELAQQGVPTVVGFRWDLEDDWAADYAREFYNQLLFRSPSLEHAFLMARKKMNADHRSERIWVAPMMILQDFDGV